MQESNSNSGVSYGRFYSWPRLLSFTLAMILIEFFYTSITTGITIGTLERDAEVGLTLAVFLVWLVYYLKLRPYHVFLLIWLSMFVVRFFNNMIEGYFFTDVFGSASVFIMAIAMSILISFLVAAAAGFILLHPEFNESLWARSREMISRRSRNSWIIRIIAASPLFFIVYFAFGMAVSPFVYQYYQDPTLGLKIPPFTVMIPIELMRGLIFTLALIPLIVAVGTSKPYVFIATSMMLCIPASLIPMIEAPLPVQIIPFHIAELLADSLVFGLILTWLFTPPGKRLSAGLAIDA